MSLLKEKCSLCSAEVVKNSSEHFKFDCNHSFCSACVWELTQSKGGVDAEAADKKPKGTMVLVECPHCHRKTPFNQSVLPDPPVDTLGGEFGDISLNDSDMDDLEFGDENQGPRESPSKIAEIKSLGSVKGGTDSNVGAKVKKIRELIEIAEKKFSERLIKHDSDKIASVCQALEKKSTKSFSEIMDAVRKSSNDVFDEAQLSVDKKIDYLRRSSTDLKNRIIAKADAIAALRKTIDEMSFFNASNSDAACVYMKVAKLEEEISNLSDVSIPFGSFKETPVAESFFSNYCRLNLGTFNSKLASTQTPSPLLLPVPQPPKSTPSPSEWPATVPPKVKEEPAPPKISPPVPPPAPLAKIKAQPKSEPLEAPSKETSITNYDAALYNRMKMFAMITNLGDEKRSLCRPVGICAFPGSKRQVAVVHTGHKVTMLSAAANVVATYVLFDPDGKGRPQLVGDIAADSTGWVYVIDRDNLPSRIFAFQPDCIAPEERNRVTPDVFARFTGRTRIYGLAASSSKQMLYTSTRNTIVAFSLGNGQVAFECPLKDPPSAYVHSLFEDTLSFDSRLSHIPFVVFTANEGRSVYKKAIIGKGGLETAAHVIAAQHQPKDPISLVRRTCCDPSGNVLGADSGNKEIRVFSPSGEPLAKFAPPTSYGPAFSASGVAVIPAHSNQSQNHVNVAEKCQQNKTHLGPVVVVTDFERHRILFFDVE